MAQGQPLALDPVDAAGRCVEQDVHEVVGQQVDLVDVQDAPVGVRQESRLDLDAVKTAARRHITLDGGPPRGIGRRQ